jgi:DNA invertase Pin-like site-specific DNA recombinase
MAHSTPPLAYSYIRFSTPDQIKGDSLRRQTEATAAWCAAHGVRLDDATTYRDLGKSAYTGKHRENPDRHALAAFLRLVEAGKVPRGSYLIVENLDRLTREHLRAAVGLFMSLLDAGVNLVTTSPERVFRHDSDDMTDVIIAVVDLARGHGESKRRADLVSSTWEKKKAAARALAPQPPRKKDGRVTKALTGRLPAWVKDVGGELKAIPDRAAVVKQIFRWSAAGYGQLAIVKKLEAGKVPPFQAVVRRRDKDDPAKFTERPGRWNSVYVKILLNDRRTLGEFQLRTHAGAADGPPIRGYFPAILTEAEFAAARAGSAARNKKGPRQGKHLDLFNGLLKDARDGSTVVSITRVENGRQREGRLARKRRRPKRDLPVKRSPGVRHSRLLVNLSANLGHAACLSFPLPIFEAAVLSQLAEIDPREILNGDKAPQETVALAAQLAGVEARVAELESELEKGEVPAAMRVLRKLEGQKRDIAQRLAEARHREAHPLAESWGELQALLTQPEAPGREERRVRLRSVLRRVVDEVRILIVPRGRSRICCVQIWFRAEHAGRQRSYIILNKPSMSNGRYRSEGHWSVRSLATVAKADALDLRRPEDVAELEGILSTCPLA